MGRILAIDYGRKRTGVAVTDPEKIIAGALTTVPTGDLLEFIKEYTLQEKVDCIVVGFPRKMDNQPSEIAVDVRPFVKKLSKLFPGIAIEIMDERFTSRMAEQTMRDAGLKRGKRRDKGLVDRISATIILQSYLESENNISKD